MTTNAEGVPVVGATVCEESTREPNKPPKQAHSIYRGFVSLTLCGNSAVGIVKEFGRVSGWSTKGAGHIGIGWKRPFWTPDRDLLRVRHALRGWGTCESATNQANCSERKLIQDKLLSFGYRGGEANEPNHDGESRSELTPAIRHWLAHLGGTKRTVIGAASPTDPHVEPGPAPPPILPGQGAEGQQAEGVGAGLELLAPQRVAQGEVGLAGLEVEDARRRGMS